MKKHTISNIKYIFLFLIISNFSKLDFIFILYFELLQNQKNRETKIQKETL